MFNYNDIIQSINNKDNDNIIKLFNEINHTDYEKLINNFITDSDFNEEFNHNHVSINSIWMINNIPTINNMNEYYLIYFKHINILLNYKIINKTLHLIIIKYFQPPNQININNLINITGYTFIKYHQNIIKHLNNIKDSQILS